MAESKQGKMNKCARLAKTANESLGTGLFSLTREKRLKERAKLIDIANIRTSNHKILKSPDKIMHTEMFTNVHHKILNYSSFHIYLDDILTDKYKVMKCIQKMRVNFNKYIF